MKKLERLCKWILISILLQITFLVYINFVYLPNRGIVKATLYELTDDLTENRSMKISADAKNIHVSFSGLFTAFMNGGNLVIADIKKNKTVKSINPAGGEFTYYRWLPDREILIYSVKSPGGGNGEVQISTYDIDPGLERSYPKISGLPDGSSVSDIELSPLTNVVYVMINIGDACAKIYRYDIMDNISFIMNSGTNSVIKETTYSDNLVYQTESGKITSRNGTNGKNYSISLNGKVVLLAVDSEDNIYVGELNEEKKVLNIKYGKCDQKVKTWLQIKLNVPVVSTDVFVTPDGTIYCVERQENRIYTVGDGSDFSYDGELLEVLDHYIVSKNDNWLKLLALK